MLGAAWTVGELGALAAAGAASVTWYETTGWRGVLETADGPAMPELFPSLPGQVFPIWHVFAALAAWREGQVWRSRPAIRCGSRGLRSGIGDRVRVLVANVTPVAQRVRVTGLGGDSLSASVLDDASAVWALAEPLAAQAWTGAAVPIRDGAAWLGLGPYAVARLDARPPAAPGCERPRGSSTSASARRRCATCATGTRTRPTSRCVPSGRWSGTTACRHGWCCPTTDCTYVLRREDLFEEPTGSLPDAAAHRRPARHPVPDRRCA